MCTVSPLLLPRIIAEFMRVFPYTDPRKKAIDLFRKVSLVRGKLFPRRGDLTLHNSTRSLVFM